MRTLSVSAVLSPGTDWDDTPAFGEYHCTLGTSIDRLQLIRAAIAHGNVNFTLDVDFVENAVFKGIDVNFPFDDNDEEGD